MRARLVFTTLAVFTLSTTAFAATARAASYPHSIASTGNSITRAYNTGLPYTDAPENSWSTGTNSAVNSHYTRLLALTRAISGKNFNGAHSGAKMSDLAGQMAVVVARRSDYVTVEMGGNDVCTSSVATMTDVALFRTQFTSAMDTIAASTRTKVFVASLPDTYELWNLFHDDPIARFFWAAFGICQSLLANPESTDTVDVERRAQVRQRNIDFNTQLKEVCALYVQCRYDGDAVFNAAITTADVSTRDYFHPSLAGQAKLASVTWQTLNWDTWHN